MYRICNQYGAPLPDKNRMGLEEDDDTLLILGRYALIEQQAEQQEYLDTVPLDVWRLTSDTRCIFSIPSRLSGDGRLKLPLRKAWMH